MGDDSFDLRPYLDAARRWWWILLLGPVMAGVAAYIVSSGEELTYQAEATVLIQSQGSNRVTPTLSDIQISQRLWHWPPVFTIKADNRNPVQRITIVS